MIRSKSLLLTTVLAAGLWLPAAAYAQNSVKTDATNPPSAMNPSTGQINPGVGTQAPSGSPPGANDQSGQGKKVTDRAPLPRNTAATNEPIPSPAEARAAFHQPLFKEALVGDGPSLPQPLANTNDAKKFEGAGGGEGKGGNTMARVEPTASGSDGQTQSTTGSGDTNAKSPPRQDANGGDEPRSGPIGAVGQTMPAKFSKRNDTMDRLPSMAFPLAITEQERQKVYQTVMSEKGDANAAVADLKPADQLPANVALNAMHPLPQAAASIGNLKSLSYVKAKDKVLLVDPNERIVLDVISG